jgi:uncharacterized protein
MTTIPTGRFVWFEYVAADPGKARAFFAELFHWKAKRQPMPQGDYTMITLGDDGIGGYMPPPPGATGHAHWLPYLQVANAKDSAAQVTSLGGRVVKAPFAVGGTATMAVVVDPLGAAFALWQPEQVEGSGDYKGVAGAWVWNELYSDDPERSLAFYQAIGGFEHESMKMGGDGPGPDRYEILKSDGVGRAGIMKLPGVPPHWMPYVQVADTDATVARAKKLGADVKNVETVPGVGRFAIMLDPLHASLGVLQPEPK